MHLGEEANDAASLVSDSTGRDSALGSTSIAGVEEDEEVEGAGALVDKVTRSFSLPEQLGALGGRVTAKSGGEGKDYAHPRIPYFPNVMLKDEGLLLVGGRMRRGRFKVNLS